MTSKKSPVRRNTLRRPPLPRAASSLIYRLRSRGYRIDTKARTIYIPVGSDVSNLSSDCGSASSSRSNPESYHHDNFCSSPLNRLRSEFGFQLQTCLAEDSSRARVYISGPIAHYDLEERRKAFSAATRRLRRSGYLPVNPMANGLPQPGDWRQHMRIDIANLLRCQYIYLLDGWQYSKGCRLELDVAMSCGLHILNP